MAETMKAVRLHEYGGPELLKLEDVPRPGLGDNELLVRVHAVGINPIDCKTRAGEGASRRWGEGALPVILGWDISGVVAESNSEAFRPGDEVFSMVRFREIGNAYAEYLSAPAEDFVLKPTSIDHLHAAATPLAALTAWQGITEIADVQPGQRVLVQAAAGGVGHFALQFAKSRGATVIGTASGRNEDTVRALGADDFVDYTSADIEDAVAPVDAVIHTIHAEHRSDSWRIIKPGGVLVSTTGPVPDEEAQAHGARAGQVMVRRDAGHLTEIAKLIDAGAVKPQIDTVYPLEKAAEAHRHVETGHTRGKVVLEVAS